MMNMLLSIVAVVGAALLLSDPSHAWISSSTTTRSRIVSTMSSTAMFSTVDKEGKQNRKRPGGKSNEEYDVEQTRSALEALMCRQSPSEEAEESLHILTSAGRHRRQLEMDLLRNLYLESTVETCDENEGRSRTVDELMHLWMYEHDAESALQLEAMQVSCSPGMVLEEEQLRIMCARFPTWAEPRARLAIVLFVKGVSAEAYDMALEALELKPWHFEVFPILVMICLRHYNMGQALYWARRSLPSFRSTERNDQRRKAWVDQALAQAAQQWEQAERETIDQERRCGALDGACTLNDNSSWQ